MNSQEYKTKTNDEDVLDYRTLKATKEELERIGQTEILSNIERILTQNRIEKPTLHSQIENESTNFYIIDLSFEDIDTIVSMFFDLEVGTLGSNYETTSEATFYAKMLDKWSNLPSYKYWRKTFA